MAAVTVMEYVFDPPPPPPLEPLPEPQEMAGTRSAIPTRRANHEIHRRRRSPNKSPSGTRAARESSPGELKGRGNGVTVALVPAVRVMATVCGVPPVNEVDGGENE